MLTVNTAGCTLLLAIVSSVRSVDAQSVIHSWPVEGVPIGDVDGDGVRDRVEYEWPWYSVFRFQSGRTGTLLAQHIPALPNTGASLLGDVGDVNGDGRDDFAFHVRQTNSSFAVRIVSPTSGALLHAVPVQQGTGGVTYVVRLGDINGDGKAEFGLGDAGATVQGVGDAGRFDVHDGATGAILRSEFGTMQSQYYTVNGVGDLDADGRLDYMAVPPTSCTAISGATGLTLFSFPTAQWGGVTPIGDVNGDGRADFAFTTVQSPGLVRVEIRSGVNGAVLWSTGSSFAAPGIESAMGSAGDFDGDGCGDFVVGASSALAVRPVVISGRTFTPLLAIASSAGIAGDSPGDADGDGVPDLWFSPSGSSFTQIVSGLVAGVAMSGTSCPDSSGQRPVIGVSVGARLGQTVSINMAQGHPTTQIAVLGTGISNTNWNGVPLPFDLGTLGYAGLAGCLWSVAAEATAVPATVTLAGGRKAARFPAAVPNNTQLLGLDLFWQWAVFEASLQGPVGAVTRVARTRIVP